MRFVANQKNKKIVAQARLNCVFGGRKKSKTCWFCLATHQGFLLSLLVEQQTIKLLGDTSEEISFITTYLLFFFFQSFVLHHVIHQVLLLSDWVLGSTYYFFFF